MNPPEPVVSSPATTEAEAYDKWHSENEPGYAPSPATPPGGDERPEWPCYSGEPHEAHAWQSVLLRSRDLRCPGLIDYAAPSAASPAETREGAVLQALKDGLEDAYQTSNFRWPQQQDLPPIVARIMAALASPAVPLPGERPDAAMTLREQVEWLIEYHSYKGDVAVSSLRTILDDTASPAVPLPGEARDYWQDAATMRQQASFCEDLASEFEDPDADETERAIEAFLLQRCSDLYAEADRIEARAAAPSLLGEQPGGEGLEVVDAIEPEPHGSNIFGRAPALPVERAAQGEKP